MPFGAERRVLPFVCCVVAPAEFSAGQQRTNYFCASREGVTVVSSAVRRRASLGDHVYHQLNSFARLVLAAVYRVSCTTKYFDPSDDQPVGRYGSNENAHETQRASRRHDTAKYSMQTTKQNKGGGGDAAVVTVALLFGAVNRLRCGRKQARPSIFQVILGANASNDKHNTHTDASRGFGISGIYHVTYFALITGKKNASGFELE